MPRARRGRAPPGARRPGALTRAQGVPRQTLPMSATASPDIPADSLAAPKPRLKRLRLAADPARGRAAGPRLLRLRPVRVGRLGPALARTLLADQGRAELAAARRPRPSDRRAQPAEPRDPHPRPDPADGQGGGDLDRGQALLHQQRRRRARDRPRLRPGRAPQRQRPGRLDDRAAADQELPPGAVAPHDLREAQGGGARLPARPQVVEGQDRHGLPEHRLLRQRRLRDRGRRADLLRPRRQPRRLRDAGARTVRAAAPALGGGAAGRDHPEPHRLEPDDPPRGRARTAQHGAAPDVPAGLPVPRRSTRKASSSRCPPRTRCRRPRCRAWKAWTPATSRAGSASRSSNASAPRAPSRAA